MHLTFESPTLALEHLDSIWGLQLSRQPPNLYGLVRFMQVDCIGRAIKQRAEKVDSLVDSPCQAMLSIKHLNVCH